MNLSKEGAEFIASFEGFRANPYLDSVKVPTIGYGTTVYPNGVKVTLKDTPITKETALSYLLDHVNKYVSWWVNKNIPSLTQTEFDAVCSLAYNVGTGNLMKSTLRAKILANAPCEEQGGWGCIDWSYKETYC
jgi:lysozyme